MGRPHSYAFHTVNRKVDFVGMKKCSSYHRACRTTRKFDILLFLPHQISYLVLQMSMKAVSRGFLGCTLGVDE